MEPIDAIVTVLNRSMDYVALAFASALTACFCLYCVLAGIKAFNAKREEEKRERHDALMRRLGVEPEQHLKDQILRRTYRYSGKDAA